MLRLEPCSPPSLALPKDRLLITVYADDDDVASSGSRMSADVRNDRSARFLVDGRDRACGPAPRSSTIMASRFNGGPAGNADADGDRFPRDVEPRVEVEQGCRGRGHLPRPSIDTRRGLERIAAVMKGTHDYSTTMSLFRRLGLGAPRSI